ncbi:Poly(ADP-ribose) glycohydrolase [Aphelenchoides besseyi]|nr:Poly(ADP-ribose) glycohydrolase [Aphelenchoides besseyi]
MSRSRLLRRSLADEDIDVYLARYDPESKKVYPIEDPYFPDGVPLLRLPHHNPERYELIYNSLTRLTTRAVTFSNILTGMKSYLEPERVKNTMSSLMKYYFAFSGTKQTDFLQKIVPFIANLALELNGDNFKGIPLITQNSNLSVSMSQRQAAILLANAFFCTFERDCRPRPNRFNTFDMFGLYDENNVKGTEKLNFIISYFNSLSHNMPEGMITILRQSTCSIDFSLWDASLADVFLDNDNVIENCIDEAHVDFANKLIGGGVFSQGCLQEEIRFLISPECLISCLLCEMLNDNEAILILGAQRFSFYEGYGNTFKYVGGYRNRFKLPRTLLGHHPTEIIAIDALPFEAGKQHEQFYANKINRELKKAFIGFAIKTPNTRCQSIATGNWGCGAFGGNLELKFLIQWLAASLTGRDLHYFTFKNYALGSSFAQLKNMLEKRNLTFEWLYQLLTRHGDNLPLTLLKGPLYYVYKQAKSSKRLQDETNSLQLSVGALDLGEKKENLDAEMTEKSSKDETGDDQSVSAHSSCAYRSSLTPPLAKRRNFTPDRSKNTLPSVFADTEKK